MSQKCLSPQSKASRMSGTTTLTATPRCCSSRWRSSIPAAKTLQSCAMCASTRRVKTGRRRCSLSCRRRGLGAKRPQKRHRRQRRARKRPHARTAGTSARRRRLGRRATKLRRRRRRRRLHQPCLCHSDLASLPTCSFSYLATCCSSRPARIPFPRKVNCSAPTDVQVRGDQQSLHRFILLQALKHKTNLLIRPFHSKLPPWSAYLGLEIRNERCMV
mmetsp:Transcript_26074/g.59229  ORF Transcript_26074/g.59229 Transcript_26074/m.59229 type:complete len:217 (+) Transcript_26074:811-1461(+)